MTKRFARRRRHRLGGAVSARPQDGNGSARPSERLAYDLVAKANVLRGLIDMFTITYPQLQEIDLRVDVPRLEVPFYLVDGTAELAGRRDLALEWYEALDAPIKRILTVDGAAHAPALEKYEAFHRFLVETVVPETYGGA